MTDKLNARTIQEALTWAEKILKPKKFQCEAHKNVGHLEAEILLAHVLKQNRVWLLSHSDDRLLKNNFENYYKLVTRRAKHEPIAYITGHKEFYGFDFLVTQDTLIPRPESELLVDLVRQKILKESDKQNLVWDVGTGSGAIGITIAKLIASCQVLATDVSLIALKLANKNAKKLDVKNINFFHADLLDHKVHQFLKKVLITQYPVRLIITANLPYLPLSDKKKLIADVVDFEPKQALFAGQNGLLLIKKLLHQLADFNLHFSSAFFEFDPPQTELLNHLVRKLFPDAKITIHKDLAKRNRVIEINLA